jgi:hypothetical protein
MFGTGPDAIGKIVTQIERGSTVAIEWTWPGGAVGGVAAGG